MLAAPLRPRARRDGRFKALARERCNILRAFRERSGLSHARECSENAPWRFALQKEQRRSSLTNIELKNGFIDFLI